MAANCLKPNDMCAVHFWVGVFCVWYYSQLLQKQKNLDIDSSILLKRHLGACSSSGGLIWSGREPSRPTTRPIWRARNSDMLARSGLTQQATNWIQLITDHKCPSSAIKQWKLCVNHGLSKSWLAGTRQVKLQSQVHTAAFTTTSLKFALFSRLLISHSLDFKLYM